MSLKSMANRLFSKDKNPASDNSQQTTTAEGGAVSKTTLAAHLTGTAVSLAEVSDQTFASGALGPGAAIEPAQGKLVAPANGKITVAFPTGHAVGMRTEEGLEILMHIGFDTVELDGKFFNPVVTKGQEVKRGDVLVEFDIEGIKAAGYPLTTPLVITNAKTAVENTTLADSVRSDEEISAGDVFLEVEVKGTAN
ncbi:MULTISPECIES: PTS sugar transporter subunit IIA [Rothia]|uniref:PTS glucose transporter subunit IIA n=1 Tax=Rothia amarae TaxID=169480 RepID=A0A7H2BL45_9MICC|nr:MULTISPECIES: PTS glucose transporter subunit IIA [Rothia]QNV40391.1 PTS glucose transporter subunit IIA [Rothia amarae]SIK85429.1 PTS system N-acetylglucosamine-specific IIA component, Glc family [Mycobacteroides abscessus subsp. abscessus]